METRPKSNMHKKINQFNTTFKTQGNHIQTEANNKKHPIINKTKYGSGSSFKNNTQNIGLNNNSNMNIIQQNGPYLKKLNNNNHLEALNHPGRHNESASLNNNKMEANILEKEFIDILPVDSNGNKPSPRFGHSLVMINNIKVCIFGGAIGDTRRINYSNETYLFNILTKLWIKLEINKNKPMPQERAAHAAAVDENSVMMIYGGSTKNGNKTKIKYA